MSIITEYIKKKINFVRFGSLYLPDDSPPVNITKILRNPKNILIIPYNRFGTILLATRVFKSFREHFKSAKITVAVNNTWSIIIQNDPTVDKVFTYGNEVENPQSKAFQITGRKLAENNFDLSFFLSYQFDQNMAYLARLSGSDLRVAFKTESEIQFFNVEVVPAPGIRYEVDRYLEMIRTLGIKGSMRDYTMAISESVIKKARARYIPGSKKRRFIGFDLTQEIAGEPMNRKNAESLIKILFQEVKARVIVFYEPEKRAIAAALKESLGKSIILVEDRPISMVAGLLPSCSFVLTHNTDMFQLAVALKIPTLCMLTKDEMTQWSPGENKNLIHLERSVNAWPSPNMILPTARRLIRQNG